MNIHYLSYHSILEYDEVSLFTELGHNVFSNGAYLDPGGHITLPRPGISGALYYEKWANIARNSSRNSLPSELIEPFDAFVIMSGLDERLLFDNWERIKHKKVIWRTIGQSLPHIESGIARLRQEGLKIVRYSPAEKKLANYAGEDVIIRFYKDPAEFGNWNGKDVSVLNATQSMKGRRYYTGYDYFMAVTDGLPRFVLGDGNENLGKISLGSVSYERFKDRLRDHRVYLYMGTWPASYTLGFIEAWMTGIPVVAIGKRLFQKEHAEKVDTYEVEDLISHTKNGFVSDNIETLKSSIKRCLKDREFAKKIGEAGRKLAIAHFGKEGIKKQWEVFLNDL